MLQMDEKQYKIIEKILSKYPYHFYAFGSRAHGNAKQYSNLDLCFKDLIPSHVLIEIEEEFEESDLPFMADLIDWKNCSKEFQRRIEKDLTQL